MQPLPENPREVEDNHVASRNQLGEIAKVSVLDRATRANDDHQSTIIPPREWLLCDSFGREMEVEVRGVHLIPCHPEERPTRDQNNARTRSPDPSGSAACTQSAGTRAASRCDRGVCAA